MQPSQNLAVKETLTATDLLDAWPVLSAVERLEAFNVGFRQMVRKRAGWLSALFLGEMLTATAMGYFEREIERTVVLALFVPASACAPFVATLVDVTGLVIYFSMASMIMRGALL